jgi:hypothetical protein
MFSQSGTELGPSQRYKEWKLSLKINDGYDFESLHSDHFSAENHSSMTQARRVVRLSHRASILKTACFLPTFTLSAGRR